MNAFNGGQEIIIFFKTHFYHVKKKNFILVKILIKIFLTNFTFIFYRMTFGFPTNKSLVTLCMIWLLIDTFSNCVVSFVVVS